MPISFPVGNEAPCETKSPSQTTEQIREQLRIEAKCPASNTRTFEFSFTAEPLHLALNTSAIFRGTFSVPGEPLNPALKTWQDKWKSKYEQVRPNSFLPLLPLPSAIHRLR